MALERDVHMLDTAMDLVVASCLTKSCLSSSCKSSDFVLKEAEKAKLRKDKNSANPISTSSTMRFVPLIGSQPLWDEGFSLSGSSQRIRYNRGD
jgi:hypothetical protein